MKAVITETFVVCVHVCVCTGCGNLRLSVKAVSRRGRRETRAQARNIVWERERAAWQVNNQSCSAGRHGNEAWQHRQRRRHAHKERHTHTHTHIKRRAGIRFKVQIHTHTLISNQSHKNFKHAPPPPPAAGLWPLIFTLCLHSSARKHLHTN